MLAIEVKHIESMYELSEDGEFICSHIDHEVIPPCCLSAGSSGYIECGCAGLHSVICHNRDCDGIDEWRAQELIEQEYDHEW